MARFCWQEIMTVVFLKLRGCINTTENIISLILQEIPILFVMPLGDNPYGPFTYQGRILNPVIGWTSHHSICKVDEKWYLFYHDSSLSKGVTHLRSIKVTEIIYNEDGTIVTINPYNNQD